jgi:Tol biopolymer transport system component/DNA-binding winged helix-turn-helix (wHTH) protein
MANPSDASPTAARTVRFERFELDRVTGELSDGLSRTPLPNQLFHILDALLERPGELVSREDLRRRLWPDHTFVDFEKGLNAAIRRLRDALGDSAESPRIIETIPRRGYRLVAPVSVGSTAATPGQDPVPIFHSRRGRLMAAIMAAALFVVAVAASSLWWTVNIERAEKASAPPRSLTRLTFGPGFDTDPTWSPDGRFVAYASNRSGNYDIWVQALAGGDPVQLTRSPAADTKPTWSPDGSDLIVFRSERDGGGLFGIPAHGGPERRLTKFGFQPKWAPDGSQILFASSDRALSPRFFVVGVDGAPPKEVLQPFTEKVDSLLGWNWHSDSRRVTFLAHHAKRNMGIFTVPLSGSPILPDDSNNRANQKKFLTFCQCPSWAGERRLFEWASSGAAMYFQCARDLTMDVWRAEVDPGTLAVLRTERLTTGTGQTLPLAVSPDGRRIAFTSRTMRLRLWAFPFDAAAGRITGNGEPVTEPTAYVWESSLAPDGQSLAYSISREGSARSELWTSDLTTGERRQIGNDDQSRWTPQWSRDGRYLAYAWSRVSRRTQAEEVALVVSRADGSEAQPITTPRSPNAAGAPWFVLYGWSADSNHVLGSSELGLTAWSLAAAPRAETAARVLASSPRYDLWQGTSSPNGRWVSFLAQKRDEPEVYIVEVIPATGGDERHWVPVTDQHGWADKPRWSPDGKLLYFITRKDGFWNLWAVRFDAAQGKPVGAPFQVTHFGNPERELSPHIQSSEVGISAKRLVLTMMERTGSIWTVDTVDR